MSEANSICKIVIDSNIWVSFLIGKRLSRFLQYILDEHIVIITCKSQLLELSRVFEKPKVKKLIHPDRIRSFFNFLEEYTVSIPVTTITDLCRDPKDNYLLSLSIDARVHYLVTGDNDLLALRHINNTVIINFADFEMLMGQRS
ncbi:MAG: putative toxin-antitoxin system toxin component, PIN family [Prevotellaceae bacterium]|jgi:putative PIN family toxin of toxin-antitoxin system|nr:putative toxin-antitoxin system toxin component, PIN family [Prevotellaceae bacterium]